MASNIHREQTGADAHIYIERYSTSSGGGVGGGMGELHFLLEFK